MLVRLEEVQAFGEIERFGGRRAAPRGSLALDLISAMGSASAQSPVYAVQRGERLGCTDP
jgi:hypothetical protein